MPWPMTRSGTSISPQRKSPYDQSGKDAGLLDSSDGDSDYNDGDAPKKIPWRKDKAGKDAGVPDVGADSGSDYDDGDADNGTAGTLLGVPVGADLQSVCDDNDQDGNESSSNPTNVNNDEGAGNVASSG